MNRFAGLALVMTLTSAPALAKPTTWEIDPAHTTTGFTVRHMMVTNVHGDFSKVSGTVVYDPENLAASKADVTVDASSIDTHDPKRDAHLKSPDFFDVAKFPTLTFKSKKITKSNGGLKLTGDLTIHGVTKEVTFDVKGLSAPLKDPFGTTRLGAEATATISRKDFGLLWNKALESGGVLVGDPVTITFDVSLKQAK